MNSNWDIIQLLKKDIVFLFLQIRDYDYIMGDLYWGSVYSLPYWEYLNPGELEGELDRQPSVFIQNGCLIILLAMCLQKLDRNGSFIDDKLARIKDAVKACKPEGGDSQRLLSILIDALDRVERGEESDADLHAQSRWVHSQFVQPFVGQLRSEIEF